MRISKEIKKYSKVMPRLIKNLNEWIENHLQVVNSPIYNDTLLVLYPERPGKKIRVSKLLYQVSIHDLHSDFIYESIIYQL